MNFPLLLVVVILSFNAIDAGSDMDSLPFVFKAGDTARAAAANENFTFLLNRIRKAEASVDSLKKTTAALKDSVGKMKTELDLPIGAIIGLMLSPAELSIKFPKVFEKWKLANGDEGSNEYKVAVNNKLPDLRGKFLRGLNAGLNDSSTMDLNETERVAGGFQRDTLKSHNHNSDKYNLLLRLSDGKTTLSPESDITPGEPDLVASKIIAPYGGSETRPRNVAVYWYIKVK